MMLSLNETYDASSDTVTRTVTDEHGNEFTWEAARDADPESDTHGAVDNPVDVDEVLAMPADERAEVAAWRDAVEASS